MESLTAQEFEQTCICLTLQRSARKVARSYDYAFRPLGLTSGQFTLLASLLRPDPVAIGILADELGLDRTTLTRNLQMLEESSWVESSVDPNDARLRKISLTGPGYDLLNRAIPIWRGMQAQRQQTLSSTSLATLQQTLDKLG